MEWIEAKIITTSEGTEPITGFLMECGVTATQIQDDAEARRFLRENPRQWDYLDDDMMSREPDPVAVIFYLSRTPAGLETLASVRSGLPGLKDSGLDLGALTLELADKDDAVWLNAWKQYYKPFRVGKRVIIRPEWEPYQAQGDDLLLTINPGHVFGTGLHQTTQLCIKQLERFVQKGDTVLDLGCGSGILSIAALLLGADSVFACDLEPDAVDIAMANAGLNGVGEGLTVVAGNALTNEDLRYKILERRYDLVTANIVADVIIPLAGFVPQYLRKQGVFIASGIIEERLEEVAANLSANGLHVITTAEQDNWFCLVARHA